MIDYLEQGRMQYGAYFAYKLRRLPQEIARKRLGKLTCGVLQTTRKTDLWCSADNKEN